jgi:hypothetical protein
LHRKSKFGSKSLLLASLLCAASSVTVSEAQRRGRAQTPPARGGRSAAVRAVSCEGTVLGPNRAALERLRLLAGSRGPAIEALSMCAEHGGRVWGVRIDGVSVSPSRDDDETWATGRVRLVAAELGAQSYVELELGLGGDERTLDRLRIVDVDSDGKPEVFVERTAKDGAGSVRRIRSVLGFERGAIVVLGGDDLDALRTARGTGVVEGALGRVLDVEDTNADGLADRVLATAGFHVDVPRCGGGTPREVVGAAYRFRRGANGGFVVDGMPQTGPMTEEACSAYSRIRSFRHLDEATVGRAIVCLRAQGVSERDVMFRVAAWCRRFEDRCATESGFEGTGVTDSSSATDIVCPAFWRAWAQRDPAALPAPATP